MNNHNLEKMAQNYVKFRVYSELGGLAGMATGYLISSMMNSMDKRNKEEKKEGTASTKRPYVTKNEIFGISLFVFLLVLALYYAKH